MKHTLIAGFGNTYRRDDGAGRAVVNALREYLERPALEPLDDGFDDLGNQVDTIVLHQLVPELAEVVKDYELVIFVDAHVGSIPEEIREVTIDAEFTTPFVSHQFHPATVLALAQQMSGHAPECVLISLRGYNFDFGEELTAETQALVKPTTERIIGLINKEPDYA
ncbi:MAG: hydrogenase maturation protease [Anaerolineae bacterium]|nr:hydrogenase maturation protease [Anaerolineae bacterium]